MTHNITKFNNNLRVIHELPFTKNNYTAINFIIEYGSVHEPPNQKGSAHYIEHMCFKGNSKIKSGIDMSATFDKMGVYTNAYTEKKFTNYIFICPNKYIFETIDLATYMIFFSHFDKLEFKKEYNVVLEENHRDQQDFEQQMNILIDQFIYNGSCYEKPIDNIHFHKTKLKRDDLYKLYKKYYTPDKVILSLCSSIPFSSIVKFCKSHIVSKHTSKRCASYNLSLVLPSQNSYKIITKKEKLTDVTFLTLTYKTCSYFNEDIYVINFIKHMFNCGMSGRLFINLREKHGLTYASSADTNFFEHSGDFSISCETTFKKFFGKNNTFDVVIHLLNDIFNNKITDKEIEKVKGYIYGQDSISLNDNKYICEYNSINLLLNNLTHSVKNEYDLKTKNIKREDIRRVINKYFNKNNLTLCILSNKTITEQQIIPYINNLVL